MTTSVFDLFSIGIGPSSSHTVGPMRAAGRFAAALTDRRTTRGHHACGSELFGSLGATGHGHGSYNAVALGPGGRGPRNRRHRCRAAARSGDQTLRPDAARRDTSIGFDPENDLMLYRRRSLPFHPNGMTFTAYAGSEPISERTYYSIGGGFVLDDDGSGHPALDARPDAGAVPVPHRHRTAATLHRQRPLDQRGDAGQRVRPPARGGRTGWTAGDLAGDGECIDRGCSTPGVLPAG